MTFQASDDAVRQPDIPPPSLRRRLQAWLRAFLPAPVRIDARERWRACGGAALGILVAGLLSHWLAGPAANAWLVAPLGASAVLVFAVPASPLAQPWSVIGGNTLSAAIGVACALCVPDTDLAAALAVSLAVGLMFAARCLHPPGGASALLAVLSQQNSFEFALFPVLLNSALLVLAGVLYNSATGRRYPHTQQTPGTTPTRFSSADLDAALAHYNQVLDVSRDDLQALLHHAETAAFQRKLGDLSCADIMAQPVLSVEFGTPLRDAWALMRERRIKALPVIDRVQRIVGIVTVADFMRHADLDAPHDGIAARLRALLRPTGTTHSDKPEVVGQIMTRQVRVASAHRPVMELVPLFSEGGHHHIPIINDERRLVGIITQSDLVRALYGAVEVGR
ncbi:HPP family protein [Uliginosibacterium sp. H1]|uniref:HPP family protein n=1 Tax=Uliginosibacterium sp. H1 TaxID=3114757 RepID=UPI002E17C51E|nr:HPP family protein [Uliginosibacterium sp. H1]